MKFIIVGAGRLGSLLANTLSFTHEVVVIDKNKTALEACQTGCQTLVGLGFDRQILLEAQIEKADALLATTSDDATNALIARIAKVFFQVPIVIARLYNPKNAQIYTHLGIKTISTTDYGVEKAISLLNQSRLNTLHSFGHHEVEMVQVKLPAHLVGKEVNDLEVPYEINVSVISRISHSFIPSLSTIFEKDDLLVITVMKDSKEKLMAFLGRD